MKSNSAGDEPGGSRSDQQDGGPLVASSVMDTTLFIAEARSIRAALQGTVDRLRDLLGWPLGLSYLAENRDGEDVLRETGVRSWSTANAFDGSLDRIVGRSYARGSGLVGRAFATGDVQWVPDFEKYSKPAGSANGLLPPSVRSGLAIPIVTGSRAVGAVELLSAEPTELDLSLLQGMAFVGRQLGRLIERRQLEEEVASRTDRERRCLGWQLRDGPGQTVTAVGMLARGLEQQLAGAYPEVAESVGRLAAAIEAARDEIRTIVRNFLPVEGDENGLMVALEGLAEFVNSNHDGVCVFECESPVAISDELKATILFHIAESAVRTAIDRWNPRKLHIVLRGEENGLVLIVKGEQTQRSGGMSPDQLGLSILHYEADLIGAQLEARTEEGKSFELRCTLPQSGMETS